MGFDSQSISDKRVYAQNSAPEDERDGIIWVDTSNNPRETYVYSTQSNTWEPVSPNNITLLDKVENFGESEISINHTNTHVQSGGIELQNNTKSFDLYSSSPGNTGELGAEFIPQTTIGKWDVELAAYDPENSLLVTLYDNNQEVIQTKDVGSPSSKIWVEFTTQITGGNTYYITVQDSNGGSYTQSLSGANKNYSEPITRGNWRIVGGFSNTEHSNFTRFRHPHSTGSSLITWNNKPPMYGWDKVSRLEEPENSDIITADIIDADSGDTLLSDIRRQNSIESVSAEVNVGISIEFNRDISSDEEPRINGVYRRWIV